jgi:hypothetical protein
MAETMIERVAKALCAQAVANDRDDGGKLGLVEWDLCEEGGRMDYRSEARAAIAAMRKPTDAMVEAGQATECEHGEMNCGAAAAWQAMIDAALAEQTTC